MKGWRKKRLRGELDALLRALVPAFPKADLHVAHRRRWVRATRFSTQRVDDLWLDVLGAKVPIDSLVRCGVLCDDNGEFLVREGRLLSDSYTSPWTLVLAPELPRLALQFHRRHCPLLRARRPSDRSLISALFRDPCPRGEQN